MTTKCVLLLFCGAVLLSGTSAVPLSSDGILSATHNLLRPSSARSPPGTMNEHRGSPPVMQTRDRRPLPAGYGEGRWIENKLAEDVVPVHPVDKIPKSAEETALAETNVYGWPTNAAQNFQIVEEVHNRTPGILKANGPSLLTGSFMIMLTPISEARCIGGSDEPACKANEMRKKNIEKQLEEKQAEVQAKNGAKAFCGEVVHSMQFLNMMSCNLSPDCTKWMAQLRDVELIEPDGVVSAQEPAVGVGSVGVSSFSSSLEPAASATSVSTMDPRRLLRGKPRR